MILERFRCDTPCLSLSSDVFEHLLIADVLTVIVQRLDTEQSGGVTAHGAVLFHLAGKTRRIQCPGHEEYRVVVPPVVADAVAVGPGEDVVDARQQVHRLCTEADGFVATELGVEFVPQRALFLLSDEGAVPSLSGGGAWLDPRLNRIADEGLQRVKAHRADGTGQPRHVEPVSNSGEEVPQLAQRGPGELGRLCHLGKGFLHCQHTTLLGTHALGVLLPSRRREVGIRCLTHRCALVVELRHQRPVLSGRQQVG